MSSIASLIFSHIIMIWTNFPFLHNGIKTTEHSHAKHLQISVTSSETTCTCKWYVILVASPDDIVEVPVQADTPRVLESLKQLLPKVLLSNLPRLPEAKGFSDIADVIVRLQLWDPTGEHHGEEVDEEITAVPQLQECLLAQLLEP